MARLLLFLPMLVLSLSIISTESYATVVVEDARSNNIEDGEAFIGTIASGAGQEGDYEIVTCAVTTERGNSFNLPSPGSWTELDNGPCDPPIAECSHGIWGRFTNNPSSEDITCSWTMDGEGGRVFVAGSFRYSEVDPADPIIDVACNSGSDRGNNVIATAPSIITEAGSQVIRIYTYRNFDIDPSGNSSFNNSTSGSFIATSSLSSTRIHINNAGSTNLMLEGGPTGIEQIGTGSDSVWRACTIALRMVPLPRNVPTMSEWGLIGFAAFTGIAGIWYLRRKQLTA